MSMVLEIPDSVAAALRLPEGDKPSELLRELSVALYARGILSFGKARELAGLERLEFGALLSHREIPRHYEDEDLVDDLAYARR
ncbi:MAG: UPF0175 family protein [Acidobacteriota bacterium]